MITSSRSCPARLPRRRAGGVLAACLAPQLWKLYKTRSARWAGGRLSRLRLQRTMQRLGATRRRTPPGSPQQVAPATAALGVPFSGLSTLATRRRRDLSYMFLSLYVTGLVLTLVYL